MIGTSMRRVTWTAIAALLVLRPAALESRQFRSSTDVVSVYATVQDKDLRLVTNLKKEDFMVYDDGKEQPITVFSNSVTPFSAVVMLDRSGSMYRHQFLIRDAAGEFVNRLLPEDVARIGSFGNYVGNRVVISPPEFTASKPDLLSVLKEPLRSGQYSPVWIAVDQAIAALSDRTNRRVILLFTDGFDEPSETIRPVKLKDVIDRVRQNNVMVYALGFADVEQRPDREPKITKPDPDLRKLADETGGGYFEVVDPEMLGSVFSRIADELHQQYWLGYTPPKNDGKVHTIRVVVKSDRLTVRARQSYVATAK